MVLELERAKRMAHALETIRQAVRPVVGRVDAPLVAGTVVVRVPDAVHDRVAQIEIRVPHVDLRAQHVRAVLVLAIAHAAEQRQVFVHGAVAPRRVLARLGKVAARGAHLLGALAVDIGLAGLDQRLGELIQRAEVVRGVEVLLAPIESKPLHPCLDGVDVLLLLLLRIGVVEPQVAGAAVLLGDAEVEADGLHMPEVQVAVRLRRKARLHLAIRARRQVGFDDLANEIAGGGRLGRPDGLVHRGSMGKAAAFYPPGGRGRKPRRQRGFLRKQPVSAAYYWQF